jgi:hypothetical protein
MKLLEPEKRTAEQQNIEPQNSEGFFTSTFDIHCSIFDILFLSFLLDQTGRPGGQRLGCILSPSFPHSSTIPFLQYSNSS